MSSKIEYKTCSKEDCSNKTQKEFCRYHVKKNFKLSPCTWPGCQNMARGPLCHRHTDEARECNKEKMKRYHAAKKVAAQ